jgi:hypothetical protein
MGKEVPILVKVISILYYISAGFAILFAIFLFAGSTILGSLMPFLTAISAWGYIMVIFVGIMLLATSVLMFFIGKGLSKAKNWARVLVIVFACLGILSVLRSLFTNFSFSLIVQLAVHGAMGGYLLFNKEVKKIFK